MTGRLLSHLAHVELISPKLEESVEFFKNVVGMQEVTRSGDSVYLRCWSDYYHSSLILTAGKHAAMGHASWRTDGPEQLDEAVQRIESSGMTGEWLAESVGHGRAYRFRGPGGHAHEIFWEVEKYQGVGALKSTFPDRPQKQLGLGIEPRQLDHVTIATGNVRQHAAWYRNTLRFRDMAYIGMDDNPEFYIFGVLTTNEKSHDLGMAGDFSGIPGRIHHLAFWLESNDEMYRAASLLSEAGVPIEYGVGRHGIGEQTYLYFREPGGIRIEMNTGGYRNYVPDWEPHVWKGSEGPNTMFRNVPMPESMFEAFPSPEAGFAIGEAEMAMGKSINAKDVERANQS